LIYQWFKSPNAFPGHIANAYENSQGDIVLELALSKQNVFFWWPDAKGRAPDPREIVNRLTRFTFDPTADSLTLPTPQVLLVDDMEFPKIDERFSMQQHDHVFFDVLEAPRTDFAIVAPKMGGGAPIYNALGHLKISTGKYEKYYPGNTHLVQEPVFISRGEAEGDGWLLVLVNDLKEGFSELHLVDTRDFSKPQARILLPIRLRPALHGNWVDASELRH